MNLKSQKSSKNPNQMSPATKLLDKRRQMYEINEKFEKQKRQFQKQEEIFKHKEGELKDNDQKMQEKLIHICKILQDNETKRNRAEKKLKEEIAQINIKDKDLKDLEQNHQELKSQNERLEKKIMALKKYDHFLDSVVQKYNEAYNDQSDISLRFNLLTNSNNDLQQKHKETQDNIEEEKKLQLQYKKEKTNELLKLNNDIKEWSNKLEDLKQKKNNLQADVELSAKNSVDKNLYVGLVIMAIDNLHTRCQEGMHKIKQDIQLQQREKDGKPELKPKIDVKKSEAKKNPDQQKDDKEVGEQDYEKKSNDAIDKLTYIMERMEDFQTITQECPKQIEKESKQKSQK